MRVRRIAKWVLIAIGGLLVIGVIGSLMSSSDQTAEASASASASAERTADATPEATEVAATGEPSAEPTATQLPAPTPAFDDVVLTGTGDSVPRFEIPAGIPGIADISHTGTSNFAVITVAGDGSQGDLLVNAIGNYSGTVLFDEQDGQRSIGFQVTADGPWTITIRPVTAAQAWDAGTALSGSGDRVVRIDPPVGDLLTADVSHTGSSNFAVVGYGGSPYGFDLLINEIGAYTGEILIAQDTFLLEISADGEWSITPS